MSALAHRSTTSTSRALLLAAALAAATAGGGQAAWAADDGYQNVFASVLTAVGLLPEQRSPEIDYRERAPLVLPPKTALVKPVPAGASRSAAWPQDPDVIRRQKAEEEARIPLVSVFDKREQDHRPGSKEEQLKHRAIQAEVTPETEYCRGAEHSDGHCRLSPDVLRAEGEKFRASNPEQTDVVTAGVEPERTYLTEPPVGYRKPTKTVKATAEAPRPTRDQSNPLSSILPHPKDDTDSPN